MRADRSLVLTLAVLASSSCGLVNGIAGVKHFLYEDEVAFCRHCASDDTVCADADDGSFQCLDKGELAGCSAAQSLFFEQEEGGPYLSPARGSGAQMEKGFRSDCDGGRTPYLVNVVIVDLEYDTPFDDDWEPADADDDTGENATLTNESAGVFHPVGWSAQSAYSNDANDVSYLVELLFCESQVLEGQLALQVTDSPGHHSNAICVEAPAASAGE